MNMRKKMFGVIGFALLALCVFFILEVATKETLAGLEEKGLSSSGNPHLLSIAGAIMVFSTFVLPLLLVDDLEESEPK